MRLKCLNFIVFPVLIIFSYLYSNISLSKDYNYKRVGLSSEERQIYYHLSEGTERYPYIFMVAMEQPMNGMPFNENLARFGFIPDPDNEAGLPIGMSLVDRRDGRGPLVGITCAGCHVSEIRYKGQFIRLDGAPSMVDFQRFSIELSKTAIWTTKNQDALERFAAKASTICKQTSSKKCSEDIMITSLRKYAEVSEQKGKIFSHFFPKQGFGFGRADAFGAARNFIWGGLNLETNLRIANASVSYPHLWAIDNTKWLHWNSNTTSAMERNIGQALGVGGFVELAPGENQFKSSIDLRNLHVLEEFSYRLSPPPWPEKILGKINNEKVFRGKVLYDQHCLNCHATSLPTQMTDYPLFSLETIGTDPNYAINFDQPIISNGGTNIKVGTFAESIKFLMSSVKKRAYKDQAISAEESSEFEQGRKNILWRSNLAYPARHLAGIWGTAPYLHNGSVPTMFDLLLPEEQRPKRFPVGHYEYDPVKLGYRTDIKDDDPEFRSMFDVSYPGDSNVGHLYGTELEDKERWDLLEYIKTL